ncbi:fumarylacetoacetate hydrolase family protein [Halalkalibacter urbisdiaboli]|uniref:fumarylacetoacetate hydrolase family protein n=1 Tax=Halalkalibacter urbisdiaboli TaxID=1960589 RepID=UPI000B4464B1|nr:fumarylacetoacetate hydrolase family protein [Halalkalibacter urbisdiaboli]
MRIIRYLHDKQLVLAALTDSGKVYNLPYQEFLELTSLAEKRKMTALKLVEDVIADSVPLEASIEELQLTVPIDAPEVWASGVTYFKSKEARNYEATDGKLDATTFYDKVYDAARPEIFFKSTSERTVGPNDPVYLRSDSKWQIPEPELGLVINNHGKVLGYLAGNDMSCRDIEGENPLYLPQAKVWRNSCSVGPAIRLAETVENPYDFEISCKIFRDDIIVFEGNARTDQLKRSFEELISYLLKDNQIFEGTILLTGTCVVPPNEFTLADGDEVEIEISTIGMLKNSVKSLVNQREKSY